MALGDSSISKEFVPEYDRTFDVEDSSGGMERVVAEADKLFRKNWDAIERVVEALLARRRLTGKRVREIVNGK